MHEHISERMQLKLDGMLSAEMAEELEAYLDADAAAASEMQRLESIDQMFAGSQHVRAPERLAVTIMARLAQAVQTQAELGKLPQEARQAVMLSSSLVMLTMMPVMVASCWMVMYGVRNPAVLGVTVNRTIALLSMLIKSMAEMMAALEDFVKEHPEQAPVALRMIPMALLALMDYMETDWQENAPDKQEEA
jgi:anti-sigma factor RsiW